MKKILTLALSLFMCFLILHTHAQDVSQGSTASPVYKGFYLGAHASTNGWGFNARYAINNWLAFKTGYETLSLSFDFKFDELDIKYNTDLNYKTGGVLLLADFSYTRNLYISTGVILNTFNPQVEGMAVNDYKYGDIVIPAEKIGTFHAEVKPEMKASPYIAAGYQGFMGKTKRMVFNFETGIYYMGTPDITLTSDGLLAPTSDPQFGKEEYLENQFSAYKIYPVIKLNLAYRIF